MTTTGMFAFMATFILIREARKFMAERGHNGIIGGLLAVSFLWCIAYVVALITRLGL